MESELRSHVEKLISEATAGDPDEVSVTLPRDRFQRLGAALDVATGLLVVRGYQLTRVRVAGNDWIAFYERTRSSGN